MSSRASASVGSTVMRRRERSDPGACISSVADRKGLRAEDAERRAPGRFAVEGEAGHGVSEHHERLLHLRPSEAGTEAEVTAAAKGEVGLALGGDVELRRILVGVGV